MKPVSVGIIGCGRISAAQHLPNLVELQKRGEVELVAYCDMDEAKAKQFLGTHGGRYACADVLKVLSDGAIEAVLIAAGAKAHPGLCIAAAKAGKHIFVEKPLAAELPDALRVEQEVTQAGVKFQMGFCNRLAPLVQMAKRLIPRPHYSFCQSASSVADQACHSLDLAVNLFHEAPLRTVYVAGGKFWKIELDAHLPMDSCVATLQFDDGSTHCLLQHGFAYNAVLKKYHFQLFGNEGNVFLANRFKELHLSKDVKAPLFSWRLEAPDMLAGPGGYMGHYQEVEEFVRAVRQDFSPTMTVRDGVYTLAVEKAIIASMSGNCVVDMKKFLQENGVQAPER
jgi:predicted dehydrogenase